MRGFSLNLAKKAEMDTHTCTYIYTHRDKDKTRNGLNYSCFKLTIPFQSPNVNEKALNERKISTIDEQNDGEATLGVNSTRVREEKATDTAKERNPSNNSGSTGDLKDVKRLR